MAVEITRVGPEDVPRLDRVASEVFDDAIQRDRLLAFIKEPTHLLVVAVAEGEVVGQGAAVLHRHPDRATELYLDELAVTPAFRRQGIAQRLLSEMIEWGREQGCDRAWIATEDDNEPAKALYARFAPGEKVALYQWHLTRRNDP